MKSTQSTATRITAITIVINLFLSLFKLISGIMAHSSAMISDAIHSASDVFSSFVVIIGIHVSSKAPDKHHPYGHERMECVAAILLAMILCMTGLMIGKNALSSMLTGNADQIVIPGALALSAAVISILVKEAMFWYTRHYAKKLDSGVLMADAWHHRSDTLSSIGSLIGIAGARLGYPVCDALASFIICCFIVKASYDIFKDAIDKMVDHCCDADTEEAIKQCVMKHKGVLSIDFFQTRVFGNKIYVDLEISADGQSTLNEAHQIAEEVHSSIESQFAKVKHIMIHVNPKMN